MTDFKLSISTPGVSLSSSAGTAITTYVRAQTGISCYRGMEQLLQGSPPAAGSLGTELDNIARSFSPGNVASPFYPFKPPLNVQLSSEEITSESFSFLDGSDFDFLDGSPFESFSIPARKIWTGVYTDNGQNPQVGRLSVDFSAFGNFGRLRGKRIPSTPLYEGKRIDELIGYVLDYAGWPSGERVLDVSDVILPQQAFDGEDAFDTVVRLALTDGPNSLLYEDGNGRCVFKNNMARLTETVSVISQATFAAAIDGANIIDFTYSGRYQDKIIAAQINQVEREVQALAQIWSNNTTITLGANESRTFVIKGNDWFKGAVLPSAIGPNEILLFMPSVALTSGMFYASFKDAESAAINWNDDTLTIQGKLEAITTIGAGNVLCSGQLSTGLYVQFFGTLKESEQPLMTIRSLLNPATSPATVIVTEAYDGSGNYSQTLTPSDTLTAGSYKLRYSVTTTSAIAFNATDATHQLRLENTSFFNSGDVSASGGPINTTAITFAFTNNGSSPLIFPPPIPSIVDSTLVASKPTATINVTEYQRGGGPDFVTVSGSVSFVFDRDNGASIKMTAIAGALGWVGTGLQVRAMPVAVVRSNTVIYPPDFDPTDVRDGRVVVLEVMAEIPFADAETSTQEYYERYSADRESIGVSVIKRLSDSSGIDGMLALTMNSRVTIIEPQTGISNDYYVLQKGVAILPFSNYVKFQFGTERAA